MSMLKIADETWVDPDEVVAVDLDRTLATPVPVAHLSSGAWYRAHSFRTTDTLAAAVDNSRSIRG